MCDVNKYIKLYKEIEKLQPEDTLQLVLEAETEEQREFFELVGDYLLGIRQREIIERRDNSHRIGDQVIHHSFFSLQLQPP